MPSAQKGACIYKIQEVISPIHRVFRGYRILIALPNMAGTKPFSGESIPSFDKPYFICRFGDYETWEYLTTRWPNIWAAIRKMGFTEARQYKPQDYKDVVEEDGTIDGIDNELEA